MNSRYMVPAMMRRLMEKLMLQAGAEIARRGVVSGKV